MAFLVCYSQSPPDDHCANRAIYLDQRFYDMIFGYCGSPDAEYTILTDIASLRYKSPTLVVRTKQLFDLDKELKGLRNPFRIRKSPSRQPSLQARSTVPSRRKSLAGAVSPVLEGEFPAAGFSLFDDYPGEAEATTVLTECGGQTTLTATIRYSSAEIRDAIIRSGMEHGAAESYDKLAQLLAATNSFLNS